MPTVIGFLVFAVGCVLLVLGSIDAMFIFLVINTLMVGSAALILGGSSIPPAMVALAFLALRMMLPGSRQMPNLRRASASNAVFLAFTFYAVVAAVTLPFIFRNDLFVLPMKLIARNMYMRVPLRFSMQNLTTCFYTIGTCLAAILSFMVSQQEAARRRLPMLAVVVIGIHCFFGVAGAVAGHTAFKLVITFFRNATYAQLDQSVGGLARINGICPEPSSFAAYGVVWLAFATELWLRGFRPFLTGIAAAVMGLVLIAATSSTGYVGMAFYVGVLVLRCAILPSTVSFRKALVIFVIGFLGVCAVFLLAALKPSTALHLFKLLESMTVNKGESTSGEVRFMQVQQGFTAFWSSYGLGIGPGSFRSSSLVSAILGSTGFIGMATFCIYLLHVWKPLRRTTYATRTDPAIAIGAAASWTTLVATAIAAITIPSSDPGILFGIFAGIALGSRAAATPLRKRVARGALVRRPTPPRAGLSPGYSRTPAEGAALGGAT